MKAPRLSISVLRFSAGDTGLAVAAEDVVAVGPGRPGMPYIGDVLGIESNNHAAGQRVVYLRSAGQDPAAFLADPPVAVVTCHVSNILPMAPGIPHTRWQPVMGFAQIDGQMLLLLDIPSIIRALAEQREREQR